MLFEFMANVMFQKTVDVDLVHVNSVDFVPYDKLPALARDEDPEYLSGFGGYKIPKMNMRGDVAWHGEYVPGAVRKFFLDCRRNLDFGYGEYVYNRPSSGRPLDADRGWIKGIVRELGNWISGDTNHLNPCIHVRDRLSKPCLDMLFTRKRNVTPYAIGLLTANENLRTYFDRLKGFEGMNVNPDSLLTGWRGDNTGSSDSIYEQMVPGQDVFSLKATINTGNLDLILKDEGGREGGTEDRELLVGSVKLDGLD
tara:strand:+ start:438 stop:1199 length:762 start_codon:yes stop_codon:yes gene_type:complete